MFLMSRLHDKKDYFFGFMKELKSEFKEKLNKFIISMNLPSIDDPERIINEVSY